MTTLVWLSGDWKENNNNLVGDAITVVNCSLCSRISRKLQLSPNAVVGSKCEPTFFPEYLFDCAALHEKNCLFVFCESCRKCDAELKYTRTFNRRDLVGHGKRRKLHMTQPAGKGIRGRIWPPVELVHEYQSGLFKVQL